MLNLKSIKSSLKTLMSILLLSSFLIGCAKERINTQIPDFTNTDPEQVLAEIQDAQGCSYFSLIHEHFYGMIDCESGETYFLKHTGELSMEIDIDISIYLNFVPVADEPRVCSDEEILINGSFELGHGLGNNQWGVFESIDGWYAQTYDVDAPIEIQNGQNIGGLAPSDGDSKLELDSHNRNGYSASDAFVTQDIPTERGIIYSLSFDYAPRVSNNVETNRVEVYFNNQLIANLNGINKQWRNYRINVVGMGDDDKLSFRAIADNDTLGGYIDNVSLTEVCPEEE